MHPLPQSRAYHPDILAIARLGLPIPACAIGPGQGCKERSSVPPGATGPRPRMLLFPRFLRSVLSQEFDDFRLLPHCGTL